MASTGIIFQKPLSSSLYPSKCFRNHISPPNVSVFLSPNSLLNLKKQRLYPATRIKQLKNPKFHAKPIVYAAQSNFLKVIQTAWKVGKDGIDAGTSLVPDSVPRPIAKISVTVVAGFLALFVLKSFLSTAFFVLAVMGLSYFIFLALNKDEAPKPPKGDGGTTTSADDSLEEARRIMEKYK